SKSVVLLRHLIPDRRAPACETERKLNARVWTALIAVMLLSAAPLIAAAQPEPSAVTGPPRAQETQTAAERPEAPESEHQEGALPVIARLINFAILIGTLVSLLRSPLATY